MKLFSLLTSHFLLTPLTSLAGLEDALFFSKGTRIGRLGGPIASKWWYS